MPDVRKTGRTRQLAIDSTIIAVAAVVVLAVVYRLWDATFDIPFGYMARDEPPLVYAPDALFYLMMAKGSIDHFWFLDNPSLGYPFGQQLHEIPHGLDNLNLAILQVLGWVFQNPFVAVNVFFVLTFAGISVSAYLVVRRLGISRLSGAAVALLFAFVPYHFARGEAHLLLSAYWMVPVAGLLLIGVTSERPPFTADAPDRERGWKVSLRGKSSILWLLACAGLASTGSYYGAITITLLAPVVLIDFLARRRGRVVASAGVVLAAIVTVMVINLVPTFVFWAQHGRNSEVVKRGPSETEVNGLKISQLVLPTEGHRIGAFAEIQAKSTRFSIIPAERGQQLGLIGAIGFVAILGSVLISARRRNTTVADGDGDPRPPPSMNPVAIAPPREIVRVYGIATIVAILVGAVSGFSLIVAGLGLSDIRSWNRVSIFIAFFALAAVGLGLDWCRRQLPNRPWRQPVTAAAVALLVLVGIFDQVSAKVVPDYNADEVRFDNDKRFFEHIERTLPGGSAIFTLPYLFFPESGVVNNVGPYDNVRGYLHTDGLKWSWGGVIGTESDWVAGAAQSAPETMLERAAAVGFRGLVLDRRGYRADEFLREFGIKEVLGQPTFVSTDGMLTFWDMRDYIKMLHQEHDAEWFEATRAEAFRDRGSPKTRG